MTAFTHWASSVLTAAVLLVSCIDVSLWAEPASVSDAKPSNAAAATGVPRPNIVYIMADDLGFGDIKCFGKDRCRVATPNFDRLAAEGVRFTDAHSIYSVCVPSRVSIMTGRYAWRFKEPSPRGRMGFLQPHLATSQFTLGSMLRAAGYRTGYVGKWHLGTRMQTTDGKTQGKDNIDFTKPLLMGPPQLGFDDSFILPGSLDMYPYAFLRNNHWLGEVTAQKGWSAFNRVGPAAVDFEDHKVLDTFSTEAERFIAENARAAKRGRPFFLYLALTSPHTPVSPRAEFQKQSEIGPYGDFIMETDDCVGRVLRALDAHGLAANTLIMATSDHGPASYAGPQRKAISGQIRELEKIGHYPSGPYRGYKFSIYEGGLRVPFVARWPAVVPSDSESSGLIGLNDLMGTLAEVAGVELADDQAPDSISFLPLLKNPAGGSPRRSIILNSPRSFVVRSANWKLALCPGSGSIGRHGNRPGAEEAWTAAVAAIGREPTQADLTRAPFVQLFDLDADPGEATNLAGAHPERIDAMVAHLEEVIRSGRSRPGKPLTNDVETVDFLPRRNR